MNAQSPQESIGIMACLDASIKAHIIFEPTPEQSAALERIGWALFPGETGDRAACVVLAALAVALDAPGPFLERVRAGLVADGNFLKCWRSRSPGNPAITAKEIAPIAPV